MYKYLGIFLAITAFCTPVGAKSKRAAKAKRPDSGLHASGQPKWDDKLDHALIEERLRSEKISAIKELNSYLKKTHKGAKAPKAMLIVTLESSLSAIFKPCPYGYAEVAAYKASKALGQRLVPPTVLRTIAGVDGSLQFLIETPLKDLRKVPHVETIFAKIDAKAKSDMKLFYYVFGQWDTHKGNQIIAMHNKKPHLALIDNAGILHRSYTHYGDYSFIEKATNTKLPSYCTAAFPYNDVKTIRPFSVDQLKKLFGSYLNDASLRKMFSRHAPITYCIWCDVLWMKMYAHGSSIKPTKAKRYYMSTLNAYSKLNKTILDDVWSDLMKADKEQAEHLIALTLERRDQMLQAAYASGAVIP